MDTLSGGFEKGTVLVRAWVPFVGDILIAGVLFAATAGVVLLSRGRVGRQDRDVWLLVGGALCCLGGVHLLSAVSFWRPVAGPSGVMKFAAAVVSAAALVVVARNLKQRTTGPSRQRVSQAIRTAADRRAARVQDELDSLRRSARADRLELRKLALAMEVARMGTWSIDALAGESQADARLLHLIRWPDSVAHTAKRFLERVDPEDVGPVTEAIQRCVGGGEDYQTEFRYRCHDGTALWLAGRGRMVRLSDDEPEFMIGVNRDITDEKERLREAASARADGDRLRLALEAGRMGSFRWDLMTDIVDYDEADAELLQISTNPSHVGEFFKRVHEEDRPRLQETVARSIDEVTKDDGEFRFHYPDGSVRWLTSRWQALPGQDGAADTLIGVNYDITALKRHEEELAAARVQAEAANEAKGEFLANMSHEIRTPLTAVLGCSDVLDPLLETDQQRKLLDVVRNQGRLLMSILNDILDLTKIEAGKVEISQEPTCVREMVGEVISLTRPLAEAAGLQLETSIDDSVPDMTLVDSLRLRQVLLNLTGNAVKFTEEGSVSVRVSCHTSEVAEGRSPLPGEECELLLTVTDTGPGIPEERLNEIFEAFGQLDGSISRKFGGTGLGLTISQRLVNLMGGRLFVESEPGLGSIFTLRLPSTVVAFSVESPQCSSASETADVFEGPLPLRVLIAEDNASLQFFLQKVLAEKVDELTIVGDGAAAIAAAETARTDGRDFHIILLDMQMPGVDGFDAARKLRESGFEVPIYSLTAGAMVEERAAAIAAGCDGQIDKPVDMAVLMKVLADAAPSLT